MSDEAVFLHRRPSLRGLRDERLGSSVWAWVRAHKRGLEGYGGMRVWGGAHPFLDLGGHGTFGPTVLSSLSTPKYLKRPRNLRRSQIFPDIGGQVQERGIITINILYLK